MNIYRLVLENEGPHACGGMDVGDVCEMIIVAHDWPAAMQVAVENCGGEGEQPWLDLSERDGELLGEASSSTTEIYGKVGIVTRVLVPVES